MNVLKELMFAVIVLIVLIQMGLMSVSVHLDMMSLEMTALVGHLYLVCDLS